MTLDYPQLQQRKRLVQVGDRVPSRNQRNHSAAFIATSAVPRTANVVVVDAVKSPADLDERLKDAFNLFEAGIGRNCKELASIPAESRRPSRGQLRLDEVASRRLGS